MLGIEIPPGWEVTPIYRRCQLAGFFCVQGNEIHCYRAEQFKGAWLTRQDLERLTRPLFKRYGYLRTKVRTPNAQGHRFVKRLGFVETGRAHGMTYYEAERLNHARL